MIAGAVKTSVAVNEKPRPEGTGAKLVDVTVSIRNGCPRRLFSRFAPVLDEARAFVVEAFGRATRRTLLRSSDRAKVKEGRLIHERRKRMMKIIAAAAFVAAPWQPAHAQAIVGSIPDSGRLVSGEHQR